MLGDGARSVHPRLAHPAVGAPAAGAGEHCRLVLARHGQTAWNAEGRFQGQADPPLDATGQAQAEQLAAEVLALRPDVLVSSDLRRAGKTAMAVSRGCGLEVQLDRSLREIDLGLWEGLHWHQAAERFPEEYRHWSHDVRCGGGETEGEAGARAAASMRRIVATTDGGSTVVVVAHGLVLKRAMGLLAEDGTIGPAGGGLTGGPPHLDDGRWIALEVATDVVV